MIEEEYIDETDPVVLARNARIAAMAAILTTPLGLTIPLSNLAVKYLAVAHRELSGPMPAARLPATRRLVEIAVALAPPAFALFPFIWAALFLAYVRIAREWGEGVVAGW